MNVDRDDDSTLKEMYPEIRLDELENENETGDKTTPVHSDDFSQQLSMQNTIILPIVAADEEGKIDLKENAFATPVLNQGITDAMNSAQSQTETLSSRNSSSAEEKEFLNFLRENIDEPELLSPNEVNNNDSILNEKNEVNDNASSVSLEHKNEAEY